MNGPAFAGPQGVSGSAQALPDQGAVRSSSTEGETEQQSCDGRTQKAQHLRICLPYRQYNHWKNLLPAKRNKAIAAVLGSEKVMIDLPKLIDSADELRRLGVLLNQALRLAHQGRAPLDFPDRVKAAVEAIEELRP